MDTFWRLVILVDMGDIYFHYHIENKSMHIKDGNKNIEKLLLKTQRRDFSRPNARIGIKVEWIMILMFNMLDFVQINMIDIWGKIYEILFFKEFFKKWCVIAHGIYHQRGLMVQIR